MLLLTAAPADGKSSLWKGLQQPSPNPIQRADVWADNKDLATDPGGKQWFPTATITQELVQISTVCDGATVASRLLFHKVTLKPEQLSSMSPDLRTWRTSQGGLCWCDTKPRAPRRAGMH